MYRCALSPFLCSVPSAMFCLWDRMGCAWVRGGRRSIFCLGRWGVISRCWRAMPVGNISCLSGYFVVVVGPGEKGGGWERGVHTKPSSNPSPVVAQLGTTNQILSFSCESLSASVTSCGFIAGIQLVKGLGGMRKKKGPYLLGYLACWRKRAVTTPSFLGR